GVFQPFGGAVGQLVTFQTPNLTDFENLSGFFLSKAWLNFRMKPYFISYHIQTILIDNTFAHSLHCALWGVCVLK
ncbi:MAG TPA: hypothetical protein DCM08_12055, partial [Microscillaceae bacterium]|nr:hypothetical protein [Microscillaceae bacterium]